MPKVDIPRPKTLRGMDATRRADLISVEQWRYQFNMRLKETKLTQVPRKVLKYGLYQQEPVLHVDVIPDTATPGYGKAVALTKSSLFRLGASAGTSLAANFNTSSEFLRWATCKYGGRLFFGNPANEVAWTDGVAYESLGDTPRGYHIAVDNFHLLVANFEWGSKGRTHRNGIAWSHPHSLGIFSSASAKEADYRVLEEYHRDGETVDGVTGLAVMGDVTLAFTSSVIYALRYLEGQKTYRVEPVLYDKGCGFLYGLAQVGRGCIFPDIVEKNFYLYQGPGSNAEEVGDGIKDFFFADLNPAPELAQRTYVETDLTQKELRWVYVSSASAGDYDKAVVLSLRDMGWSYRSVPATNCFTPGIRLAKKVSDLSGINSAQSGANFGLGRTSSEVPALWGTKDGMLLRDEVSGDAQSVLVSEAVPFLETSDFAYDDLTVVKELDGIVLHANWTNASNITVEVAARNNLSESLSWVTYGTWDKASLLFRASEPRVSGRILRFRFTPVSTGAAAASVKDFTSGAVQYPTPGANYTGFRYWNVTGLVDLVGANANGTYWDLVPGNGVYVDLFGTQTSPLLTTSTIYTKASYTLTSGRDYRFRLALAGNNRAAYPTYAVPFTVTLSHGSVTFARSEKVHFLWNAGFANFDLSFTAGATVTAPFIITTTTTTPGGNFAPLLNLVSIVETSPGSATVFEDDFEIEVPASGFSSSLNEGGGVRGVVFDAFAEKLRVPKTQVDR